MLAMVFMMGCGCGGSSLGFLPGIPEITARYHLHQRRLTLTLSDHLIPFPQMSKNRSKSLSNLFRVT